MKSIDRILGLRIKQLYRSLLAAVLFYTCLPIPASWKLEFEGVARWATGMGLLIGGLLGLADLGLERIGMPVLTRSALIVVAWIALTGGLHLDGAMDTADGLAVQDKQRRLQVMTDSVTGAFGAIAACCLLLLKTSALTDIHHYRWLALMAAAGWGRWGQVVAIACYPYLKPTGKGAMHKQGIRMPLDIILGLLLLLGVGGLQVIYQPQSWPVVVVICLGGWAIALSVGAWFHRQLGGHTGDTYGAIVEWTEALLLCLFVLI